MPDALCFDGVVVERNGRAILDDASFSIRDGTTALVGANGSGKTTLLRVAAGLLRPRRGVVRRGGRVGFLPQRAQDAWFASTLRDEFARVGVDAGRALAAFGLEGRADRHPFTLSEGERRRAAFALALAPLPSLLLLDEPTAGLDADAARATREAADAAPAALVATHDFDLAFGCDRILVLADRRVHDAGTPAAFARSPWLERLGWEAP